jgi:hypothetical protein
MLRSVVLRQNTEAQMAVRIDNVCKLVAAQREMSGILAPRQVSKALGMAFPLLPKNLRLIFVSNRVVENAMRVYGINLNMPIDHAPPLPTSMKTSDNDTRNDNFVLEDDEIDLPPYQVARRRGEHLQVDDLDGNNRRTFFVSRSLTLEQLSEVAEIAWTQYEYGRADGAREARADAEAPEDPWNEGLSPDRIRHLQTEIRRSLRRSRGVE